MQYRKRPFISCLFVCLISCTRSTVSKKLESNLWSNTVRQTNNIHIETLIHSFRLPMNRAEITKISGRSTIAK